MSLFPCVPKWGRWCLHIGLTVAEALMFAKIQGLLKGNNGNIGQGGVLQHRPDTVSPTEVPTARPSTDEFVYTLPPLGASGSSCPVSTPSHTVWGSWDGVSRTPDCGAQIA